MDTGLPSIAALTIVSQSCGSARYGPAAFMRTTLFMRCQLAVLANSSTAMLIASPTSASPYASANLANDRLA